MLADVIGRIPCAFVSKPLWVRLEVLPLAAKATMLVSYS